MSKRTLHFLLMLLVGIIGGILNMYFCCGCCKKKAVTKVKETPAVVTPVTTPKVVEPTSNAFALNDPDGDFSFKANEHFNFNADGFKILTPVSENVNSGIEKLKTYLEGHPEKIFNITGLYSSKEENTSAYENLGVARATAVKNYLVSKGIDSKHLNTLGKLDDSLVPNGNIYQGPVTYGFKTFGSKEEEEAFINAEAEKLKAEILASPLKLYFKTGSNNISLTAEQRSKMSKIARYIDISSDTKVDAIGHTDNTGNRQANINLGLARAKTIMNYLINNGISASRIITESFGPDKPIADNATEEGRKLNRRVEVTIK